MLIKTRSMGFGLTDAILRHVESRIESALGQVSRHVVTATVRLDDVNADRGGLDKRCRVVVSLRNRATVAAEAVDADLYASIDESARRIGRAAARAVARPMARDRKDPQRPGSLIGV